MTFNNTIGSGDDEAAGIDITPDLKELEQEVLDEFLSEVVARPTVEELESAEGFIQQMEVIEKDGKRNNIDQDNIETVNKNTDSENYWLSNFLALLSQLKYVPLIFIILLLVFYSSPDISSQELLTAGVVSVVISCVVNRLVV